MAIFPPTVILRHRKENLKKCSLEPVKERADLHFFTYPKETLPPLPGYLLLTLDAPLLTAQDRHFGLFLIDATWKYARKMEAQVESSSWIKRSLPPLKTSYPRKQTECLDPDRGLASIEALYAAYAILGRDTKGLLDHYRWKKEFLECNLANPSKLFYNLNDHLKDDKSSEKNEGDFPPP